jgi:hypothetical protein
MTLIVRGDCGFPEVTLNRRPLGKRGVATLYDLIWRHVGIPLKGNYVSDHFGPCRLSAARSETISLTGQAGFVHDEGVYRRPTFFFAPSSDFAKIVVVRKNKNLSLGGLLHQTILMMQAAKHRGLYNTVTGGQLVSVVAGRNTVLVGLRNSRT